MLYKKHMGWVAARDTLKTLGGHLRRGQANFLRSLWKLDSVFTPETQLADHRQPVKYQIPLPSPVKEASIDAKALYIHKTWAEKLAPWTMRQSNSWMRGGWACLRPPGKPAFCFISQEFRAMKWRNDTEHYGALSIGLHWLMFLLIAVVYACIELREFFPKGSDPREALKAWHFMLGLVVLVLAALRLVVHLTGPVPRIVPQPPGWQTFFAKLMHLALYVLMIGLPLGGWLILSAEGKPIPFFGLQLPALVGESKALAELVEEIHEIGGTLGYFLIGLHAAASLFHHYVLRDNTLRRILPNQD